VAEKLKDLRKRVRLASKKNHYTALDVPRTATDAEIKVSPR
jgi:hypothetical protein